MAHPRNSLTRLPPAAVRAALVGAVLAVGCTDLQVTRPGAVVTVRMAPDTVALRVGDSAQVRAAPLDGSAALRSQEPVAWTSSAASVATVSASGVVRGLAAGVATITATVDGVQGQTIALVSGAPAAIAVLAGDAQSAAVNSAVAIAPSVRVTDGGGNPVAHVAVTFAVASGGGAVPETGPVLTGLDGVAAVGSWTLGPIAGANTLTATAADAGVAGNPVTFTATATVGAPNAALTTLSASPAAIAPSAGQSFSTITVTVRDSAGSTVAGASVTLAATGTGNVLTQPTAPTDAQGQATGAISSNVAEDKVISALVNGTVAVTQTVTVSVTANVPSGLVVQTQPAGAVANADFVTQPVVDIRDAFGNRVVTATDPVTVTIVHGNGALVGTQTVNAVAGRATFSGLRIRGLRATGDTLGTGAHVLQFSAPGFASVQSDTVRVGVSFAYTITDIWTRNSCATGCHNFGTHAENLAATSLSCTVPARVRVTPGDTATSFLYDKIRLASPACGIVMPTSGLMSQRQILLVRDWILAGAPNN